MTPDNKHFYLRIDLSPGGVYEIPGRLPADLDRASILAIRAWFQAEQRGGTLQRLSITTESEICQRYEKMLNNFLIAQASGCSTPRSLKLQIVIHQPNWHRRPLDQCGLTLRIDIKFRPSEAFQCTPEDEEFVKWTTRALSDIEPKRRLLLPLVAMRDVQSIDVRRTWTLHTLNKETNDTMTPKTAPSPRIKRIAMALHFHYKTARELFLAAGEDFVNFKIKGLAEAGLHAENVMAIDENTAPVINAILVLQKSIQV